MKLWIFLEKLISNTWILTYTKRFEINLIYRNQKYCFWVVFKFLINILHWLKIIFKDIWKTTFNNFQIFFLTKIKNYFFLYFNNYILIIRIYIFLAMESNFKLSLGMTHVTHNIILLVKFVIHVATFNLSNFKLIMNIWFFYWPIINLISTCVKL